MSQSSESVKRVAPGSRTQNHTEPQTDTASWSPSGDTSGSVTHASKSGFSLDMARAQLELAVLPLDPHAERHIADLLAAFGPSACVIHMCDRLGRHRGYCATHYGTMFRRKCSYQDCRAPLRKGEREPFSAFGKRRYCDRSCQRAEQSRRHEAYREVVIHEVEWIIGTDSPENIAARLGYKSPENLASLLNRWGRADLAARLAVAA